MAPDPGQAVWGVLYEIDPGGLKALDRKEGEGWAYERQQRRVRLLADGSEHDAITYTVLHKEPQEVPPSYAYLERRGRTRCGHSGHATELITAARRRGLPERYIATLTSTGDASTASPGDASVVDQRFRYEETMRALNRQATVLSELRNRANILLAANAVVATLFGTAALGPGHSLWLKIPALLAFALGILACIQVLRPVHDKEEILEGRREWQVNFKLNEVIGYV